MVLILSIPSGYVKTYSGLNTPPGLIRAYLSTRDGVHTPLTWTSDWWLDVCIGSIQILLTSMVLPLHLQF